MFYLIGGDIEFAVSTAGESFTIQRAHGLLF